MSASRDVILGRIRAATGATGGADEALSGEAAADADESVIRRDYRSAHVQAGPAELVALLAENLVDYRAKVHRCMQAEIPGVIARLLSDHGDTSVVVPDGLPPEWLAGTASAGISVHPDAPELTARDLDAIDAVVSTCALAIAETGTVVLDAGPGQGRRMLTLVPDHHVCVVRCPEQVVASVPQALPLLTPTRPQTWIAGPSATSDIELDRVEGVHGPRHLEVILMGDDTA
jgi:L-lactate dehydrogenase complex protein LldG